MGVIFWVICSLQRIQRQMTRYARALGSKSSNARVSADPTPWSEMAPPKRASKRLAGSIEEDEEIATPKKEKKTPAKKTPKVVQLQDSTPKSPVSPAATAPLSAKKDIKKTPLKPKTPNVANTPANLSTPIGMFLFFLNVDAHYNFHFVSSWQTVRA